MQNKIHSFFLLLLFAMLLCSCSTSRPSASGKKTRHEAYEKKIKDAAPPNGLGGEWLKAAAIILINPLDISIPYLEKGSFSEGGANGIGLRFRAKRGQKINIHLAKRAPAGYPLYVDLWQPYPVNENKTPRWLAAADTSSLTLEYTAMEDTVFLVRVQPGILKKGEYTISISAGPSLAFPIPQNIKSSVLSFWGDGRDNGGRKHEGIDILAPKHSPAIACANGIITRVEENALGGKVVYLRPDNAPYSLYYAHLDSQIAVVNQRVKTGDVIGLTGNTGNAKNTVSHLHFGIYTNKEAVDPLYFVKNDYKPVPRQEVAEINVNTWMRSGKGTRLYLDQQPGSPNFVALDENTLVRVEAAAGNYYRVTLPDGQKGFIAGSFISSTSKPLKRLAIKKSLPLLSIPEYGGVHKKMLVAGDQINILASFKDFYFVNDKDNLQGWVAKHEL